MDSELPDPPIDERIKLGEAICDSITIDQKPLPLTLEQEYELDRRLSAYAADKNRGRLAGEIVADIRRSL